MKYFVVIYIVIMFLDIQVCAFDEQTHQVTLSCPIRPESERGPTGVPGKRGSKGETGSMGKKICFNIFQ